MKSKPWRRLHSWEKPFKFLLAGFYCTMVFSGYLQASGLTLTDGRIDTEDFGRVTFTVSWQNAWNLDSITNPGNHDAAWIFIKYSFGEEWKHLDLSSQDVHRSNAPERLRIEPVADGKGVYLIPTFSGTGDIVSVEVTLELERPIPTADRISFLTGGIEMVYVPGGAFQLGDGGSNSSFWAGDSSGPFLVQSEAAIDFGSDSDELGRDSVSGAATVVPTSWPKGTEGFYCMKYEISQQQYGDFLKTLTADQQAAHIGVSVQSPNGTLAMGGGLPFRNGIRIVNPANDFGAGAVFGHDLHEDFTYDHDDDGQNRACNWMNWEDLCAYLDWACLRPLTEFEYEKACRGPLPALPLEFAWGTDEIVDANTLVNDGTADEAVTEVVTGNEGLASQGYSGPQGPLRCGFAAGENTSRREAGAGYYGVMEMSGNLWEQCVVSNPAGLNFVPTTGDGSLNADGRANEISWPDATGAGHRGGAWNSGVLPGFRDLAVSDRFYAGLAPVTRRNTVGGRGGR